MKALVEIIRSHPLFFSVARLEERLRNNPDPAEADALERLIKIRSAVDAGII